MTKADELILTKAKNDLEDTALQLEATLQRNLAETEAMTELLKLSLIRIQSIKEF